MASERPIVHFFGIAIMVFTFFFCKTKMRKMRMFWLAQKTVRRVRAHHWIRRLLERVPLPRHCDTAVRLLLLLLSDGIGAGGRPRFRQ
jgi:hypothetical protein